MSAAWYRIVGGPDFAEEELHEPAQPDPVMTDANLRQRAAEEFGVHPSCGEFLQEQPEARLTYLLRAIDVTCNGEGTAYLRGTRDALLRDWIRWRMETFTREDRKAAEDDAYDMGKPF